MKLFLTLSLFYIVVSAQVVKPKIDDALSHRFDENLAESKRGFANEKEEEDSKKERKPSAKTIEADDYSETGIRYWKY